MKKWEKKIIASMLSAPVCALGMAMVAPAVSADSTTVYGNMRFSVNSVDDPDNNVDGLTGADNVSLFGVKGTYGDDIKAFFHLQTGASADAGQSANAFNQRFYYAGLKGNFGSVKYGRVTNLYKMPGFKLDPFYNTAHIGATGAFSTGGATYGLSGATNGFTDDAIEYTSPKLGDMVTLSLGVYIDDSTNAANNDGEHSTVFGADYNNGAINAGVRLASEAENNAGSNLPGLMHDGDATRIYGGYKGDGWSAGASYEIVEMTTTNDTNYLYVTGRYSLTDKTDLVGSIGMVDQDATVKTDEGTGVTLAVQNAITTNTKVFALFSSASLDATGAEDPSTLSVGVFHNFSLTN
jgi:hypothetical protein